MFSNTFRLSHKNALTSNADGNAILLTYVLSAPLLIYPSLSLWASGLSVCSQQSRSYSRYCFPSCTQHSGPDWDLDSSRRLSKPLLRSNNWEYSTYTPLCNNYLLESHANTVTGPVKLHVVVIYRPPGQLGTFLEELDGLLSSFPEDGSPLIVFGDFNIYLNKPHAVNFLSLLASFDLKRLTITSTHKSGSQLDLIYTCNCAADKILVKSLHTSDHYLI